MNKYNHKPYLIIVDDESNFCESLQIALEDTFTISTANSIKSVRQLLKDKIPDAILLDVRLSDGDGIDFLQELKEINPMPVTIIITAYATIENAIKSLKNGAVDYFVKPLDVEKLKREINVYLENKFLHKKISVLNRKINKISPPFIVSDNRDMKEIIDKALMVAILDIPILIEGETGTGKENLAKWIHTLSGLEGEMVAINCASLPKDIFESEIFGYSKGAFSGAATYKEGLIEKANGGTLFLDEIGELPENIQAKFLRVLEDGVYYKLGSTKENKTRFRLITATNKNLTDPSNNFRKDLFFRINGIMLTLPPLKNRKSDIPHFISTFIKEANSMYKKQITTVSVKAMEYLMNYDWPGNIRELKWCIYRAVAVTSKEIIDVDEILINTENNKSSSEDNVINYSVFLNDAIEDIEKKYIRHALASTNNNKTEASKILGISLRVLHYKIQKYNI